MLATKQVKENIERDSPKQSHFGFRSGLVKNAAFALFKFCIARVRQQHDIFILPYPPMRAI